MFKDISTKVAQLGFLIKYKLNMHVTCLVLRIHAQFSRDHASLFQPVTWLLSFPKPINVKFSTAIVFLLKFA